MRRPSEVWLAGQRFAIRWLDHELSVDGDPCNGVLHVEKQEIRVHVEGTERFLKTILVHEILHACVASNGRRHPDDEESCVRVLENPVLDLLTDKRNAPLWRWLRRED